MTEAPFTPLTAQIELQARERPGHPALICEGRVTRWGELLDRVRRVAGALQAAGVRPGDRVALAPGERPEAVLAFLGSLWAGACPVPLPGHVSPAALESMIRDASPAVVVHSADGPSFGSTWLAAAPAAGPAPARPDDPFDVIYSSGTTGTPKGVVHPHRMRAHQLRRMRRLGIDADAVTLVATPLCSNATLITLLPTLAAGGCAVLLPRFDAGRFFELSRRHRASCTMLVPVQYRRLLEHPDFAGADLGSCKLKLCTGAPMPARLKRELLQRWPGRLVQIYGQTEGGPTTVLDCGQHPDRLDSVGRAARGVDLRIIDPKSGQQLPDGQAGEVVGRSEGMMSGYLGRPRLTEALTWRDQQGRAFYRTGDLGLLDGEGFLRLGGRLKELIISGGHNIWAADLERVLESHPAVAAAAVVAAPDPRWGETPLAHVVPRPGQILEPGQLRDWANARLGKAQRLSRVLLRHSLPRNPMGKVLKDQL